MPPGYSFFMRNPAALTAAAVLLLALGFGAGVMVGERRSVEEQRPGRSPGRGPDPVARSESTTPGKSAEPAIVEEVVRLRERIRTLEVELQTLRENPPAAAAGKGGADVAERVFEDLLAIEKGGIDDPERLRSLFSGLPQLDASSAKIFIDRYRRAQPGKESDTDRLVAIQLALMSGGPDATQFLQTLLRDSSLDPGLRSQVLGEVGATGGGLFSIRRLPVDESLGSTAMTLARSEKGEERRAGAGLLGGVATTASRLELERMLTQDPDPAVKMVAARSLGLVGDPSTRKLLEPLAAQTADPGLQKAAQSAIKELDRGPR
jgi:HEAT repeat protein